jgi:2,3-bisphosphoglycerate-dependent phosphoglycerate mutase
MGPMTASSLVLLRHGFSDWNDKGLFTGWVDVDLAPKGVDEAHDAARLVAGSGLLPDVAHTSVLKRAVRTLWICLDDLDRMWIPVRRSWRLNERHYGALQGLDKKATAEQHGHEQVKVWRRSYDVAPPPLDPADPAHPRHDPRYADLPPDAVPDTECLRDVVARMLPYWYDAIVPDLRAGRRVLVVAHGNSLRALVKHLDGISDDAIAGLNIPTGIPLVYDLDAEMRPVGERGTDDLRGRYLDPEAARTAAEQVAKQAG